MKIVMLCLLGGLLTSLAGAEPLQRFSWEEGGGAWKAGGAGAHEVLTILAPVINKPMYALTGTVSYQGVEGEGYLEMWSHFADGGQYYSRTLAATGPLQKISGSSESRPFILPFDPMGNNPVKLVLQVVLPGAGSVELGPVELIEGAGFHALMNSDGAGGTTAEGAWWSDRKAGLIFGILGSVFGCLCGLAGFLAGKGKGRSAVLGYYTGCVVLGGLSLVSGIYAAVTGQPYGVYYPLLLFGLLAGGLCFTLRRQAEQRYAKAELDRMNVLDQA